MPILNDCTPDSIYGGFDQYLFLGASVMSFTASVGLNGQTGELTVQLVEDDCASPEGHSKKYFDANLALMDWTDADPGFMGEDCNIIGAAAYFRMKDFEYSGIIQSWEKSHSTSGNPTYEVKMVDPSFLLENCKVILNEDLYPASTTPAKNIYNFFYVNEKKRPFVGGPEDGAAAPLILDLDGVPLAGNHAGWFGASSDHNENGMKWIDFEWAARIELASEDDRGIVYMQHNCTQWMGLLPNNAFKVDMSEMRKIILRSTPTLVYGISDYYRLNQPDSSMMEILTQVINDVGCEYYVELIPVLHNGTIEKIIKLRIIDRSDNIMPSNSIQTYIDAVGLDREVLDYRFGKEMRTETTQSYLNGGRIQSVVEVEDINILPYFGKNPITYDVYTVQKDIDGFWYVSLGTDDLQEQLNNGRYGITVPNSITINEKEMIIAQGGFDVWHSYASYYQTPLWNAIGLDTAGVFDLRTLEDLFPAIIAAGNTGQISDFYQLSNRGFKGHYDIEMEILQVVFGWLQKIVTEYYGKKFQVIIPWDVIALYSVESKQIRLTEKPSPSGWIEEPEVLELYGQYKDYFRTEDGRFRPFVRVNNAINLETANFNKEDIFVSVGIVTGLPQSAWIKVDQDSEFVWEFGASPYATVPVTPSGARMLITLPQQIREIDSFNNSVPLAFNALFAMATNFNTSPQILTPAQADQISQSLFKVVASGDGHEGVLNRAYLPDAAAICVESQTNRYGPWGYVGAGTIGGDINVNFDDGLVPWEYGGYTLLEQAGDELAEEGITIQQDVERGSITVAGFPDIPLGAELLVVDNGIYPGENLYENRSISLQSDPTRQDAGNMVVTMPMTALDKWNGENGPNVTSVTCRVSPSGIQTTYDIRIYTQKFGRFAKENARRLANLGKFRLALSRFFRAYSRNRII